MYETLTQPLLWRCSKQQLETQLQGGEEKKHKFILYVENSDDETWTLSNDVTYLFPDCSDFSLSSKWTQSQSQSSMKISDLKE